MIELRPEFRFSSQIRPILPGLRPFCLDLANFGRIWTILLGFGPYSLDLGPKGDKAEDGARGGRTDVQTDSPVFYRTPSPSGPLPKNGRMDEQKSPCVLQDSVPFWAAAQKARQ